MGKVDYIIINNPGIVKLSAHNPEEALEEYMKLRPAAKNVLMFPHKAGYLNGKYIKS